MAIYLDISNNETKKIELTKPSLVETFRTKLTTTSELCADKDYKVIYKHRYHINQIDLGDGFHEFIKENKFCFNDRLKYMLKTLDQHEQPAIMMNADFICTDTTLVSILNSFYDRKQSYRIIAERQDDNIYIKYKKRVSIIIINFKKINFFFNFYTLVLG